MCKSVFVHSPVFVKRQMQNLSKGGGGDGDGIWNSCHRALVCGETLLLPTHILTTPGLTKDLKEEIKEDPKENVQEKENSCHRAFGETKLLAGPHLNKAD